MWRGRGVYNGRKCSVAFWAAISCVLSALPVFFTCIDSSAESFLAAPPPWEIKPNGNGNLEPNRRAPAIGGTSIGTSGTIIGTQRPASPMNNTENVQNMEVDNRATAFNAKNHVRQSPSTPVGAQEMSKSTAVREALSESTAPFDDAGNKGPDTRPFSSNHKHPAASSDQSSADPGYRRYMEMPDRVPGNLPTLR